MCLNNLENFISNKLFAIIIGIRLSDIIKLEKHFSHIEFEFYDNDKIEFPEEKTNTFMEHDYLFFCCLEWAYKNKYLITTNLEYTKVENTLTKEEFFFKESNMLESTYIATQFIFENITK